MTKIAGKELAKAVQKRMKDLGLADQGNDLCSCQSENGSNVDFVCQRNYEIADCAKRMKVLSELCW